MSGEKAQVWPQESKTPDKRQSPIDIKTSKCIVKLDTTSDKGLKIDYPKVFPELSVCNTGHGWKVEIPEELASKTSISGGPLQHSYRLTQFHCHWGRECSVGSEHTVDGKSFAAELHFVHWNSELFANPSVATPKDNGLAVLGVFLEVGAVRNEELDKLLQNICLVKYKDENCKIAHNIDIEKLLPENKTYWTYLGSLTTPPFCETVTWIVFSHPIQCTTDQIAKFRELYASNREDSHTGMNGSIVLENYRSAQPLNDRTVTFVKI